MLIFIQISKNCPLCFQHLEKGAVAWMGGVSIYIILINVNVLRPGGLAQLFYVIFNEVAKGLVIILSQAS